MIRRVQNISCGVGWLAILVMSVTAHAQTQTPYPTQAAAPAAPAAQLAPVEQPKPGGVLRDPDFGVDTRAFGLERTVEMYQWNRAGQGYFAGWTMQSVDSTGFAPGHQNPGRFPLQSREWRDLQVTLDGKPLAPEIVARLGQWRAFRPNFSALPGNLSATFQPEGDGLGSAENPLDPQIGDLRVTWRELVLPPLADKVELRDGQWRLTAAFAGPNAAMSDQPIDSPNQDAEAPMHRLWPWLAGAFLLITALVIAWRRHHLRTTTRADKSVNS